MCGVSGIIYKNARSNGLGPVGADLVKMLDSLAHRGRDSTGLTIVGEDTDADLLVRVWTEHESEADTVLERASDAVSASGGTVRRRDRVGAFIRLAVDYGGDVSKLAQALLDTEGVDLHSIGRASEVVKDVGTATDVDSIHGVGRLRGTHGIGHVRMATESIVDINHAHPFWAYPFPDVTVVHNGQLTNYHSMKRSYEDRGHRFQTGNDSELIAVYLAEKLAEGATLEQALHDSLDDLDGTFTYLVSTRDGVGCAKDQWSAKPLVTMETADVVAIASEETALRSVFSEEIDRIEPQQGEVMTWSV